MSPESPRILSSIEECNGCHLIVSTGLPCLDFSRSLLQDAAWSFLSRSPWTSGLPCQCRPASCHAVWTPAFLLSNKLLYDLSLPSSHIMAWSYRCLLFLRALCYYLFSYPWRNFGKKGDKKVLYSFAWNQTPLWLWCVYLQLIACFISELRLQKEECLRSWHGFKQMGRWCKEPMSPSQAILELLLHI